MRTFVFASLMIAPLVVFEDEPKNPDHAATVAYMESLAMPGGGYIVQPGPVIVGQGQVRVREGRVASLRATSGVARAMPKFGGQLKTAKEDAEFVDRCVNPKSGGFVEYPEHLQMTFRGRYREPSDVFHTAVGLITVVELKMPLDKYRDPALKFLDANTKTEEDIRITAAALEALSAKSPKADSWIKKITAKRNEDGTIGQGGEVPIRTANMAMTVLRLGGELPNRDNIVRVLREGQCEDGGYGIKKDGKSDLESCYRVVRALTMMKVKPRDVDALKKFVISCRNEDGGYGLAKGEDSSASGCYYAGFVLDWLK